MRFEHAFVSIELPDGWRSGDAGGDFYARFVGPRGMEVTVTLAQAPAGRDAGAVLDGLIESDAGTVRAGAASYLRTEPVTTRGDGIVQARRDHRVGGRRELVIASRLAVSELPVGLGGRAAAHAIVVLRAFGSPDDEQSLRAIIDGATVLPLLRVLATKEEARVLYPYVLHPHTATQRDEMLVSVGREPEGFGFLPRLDNGLAVTLAEEGPDQLRPLFPVDLVDAGIDFRAAFEDARRRVGSKLGSPELPVRTVQVTPFALPAVWREGLHAVLQGSDTTKLVVVGPTWMAASAAFAPALFAHAARELGTQQLQVLMPHRDRLFVFADSGAPMNERLAEGINRAEADGRKPLSPVPLSLAALALSAN